MHINNDKQTRPLDSYKPNHVGYGINSRYNNREIDMNRRDRNWIIKRIDELIYNETVEYKIIVLEEMRKIVEYESEVQARRGVRR